MNNQEHRSFLDMILQAATVLAFPLQETQTTLSGERKKTYVIPPPLPPALYLQTVHLHPAATQDL